MEGYPNAAEKFSKEANLEPQQDVSSIRARQAIQNCIHSGNIQSAIETLNELDPEVSTLYFLCFSTVLPLYMIKTRVLHAPRIWVGLSTRDDKNHFFMIPPSINLLLSHLETMIYCISGSNRLNTDPG